MKENQTPDAPDLKKFFHHGQWKGASETICGKGSTLSYTEVFRAAFETLLSDLKIERLLDAPCGDFHWMKTVAFSGDYIGMDIVPDIIADNVALHSSARRRFLQGDITKDPLPAADLMLVRDCLFHLPFVNVANFFENFLKHRIPFVAITSNVNAVNQDIEVPGRYRPINLLLEPAGLPKPESRFMLRDYPESVSRKRFIYVWRHEQVKDVMTAARLDKMRKWSGAIAAAEDQE